MNADADADVDEGAEGKEEKECQGCQQWRRRALVDWSMLKQKATIGEEAATSQGCPLCIL